MERYFLGTYWGVRKLSLQDSSLLLLDILKLVESFEGKELFYNLIEDDHRLDLRDEDYFIDYVTRKIRHEENKFNKDYNQEVDLLTENENYFSDGGFTMSVNIRNGELIKHVKASVGKYSKYLTNVVTMDLKQSSLIKDHARYTFFLKELCEILQPNNAGIYNDTFSYDIANQEAGDLYVSGIMYFSNEIKIPNKDYINEIIPLDNIGNLVILEKELFTIKDPKHVEKGLQFIKDLSIVNK
ncbi:Imm52 family immunity protein [Flammeovirga kamogawensis]|uniref:Immunity 52 family protein n=1 Tax=Flammeovirga kamogawensis TaxID=373891 RepID=A0ABX8H2Y2_9BACT|nr:Imm52 family immunity protein [Flammeovirga kamogawensis]MBB6460374.1 hypothetical protein [Flammeovirga kamogawensis]QWG10181.1 immunity 52 family protein [Flammeovirga kamogawensis]TRX64633.1 hypothetical protein EO216_19020 [Flammeovirga kamogawensis]